MVDGTITAAVEINHKQQGVTTHNTNGEYISHMLQKNTFFAILIQFL